MEGSTVGKANPLADLLGLLKRPELQHLIRHFGVQVADARYLADLTEGLKGLGTERTPDILNALSKGTLRETCRAMDLSDSGKKASLVERILSSLSWESGRATQNPSPTVQSDNSVPGQVAPDWEHDDGSGALATKKEAEQWLVGLRPSHHRQLDAVISTMNPNPRTIVYETVQLWRRKVSKGIARFTRLRDVQVSLEVSDRIPPHLAEILNSANPAVFWALLRLHDIETTVSVLREGSGLAANLLDLSTGWFSGEADNSPTSERVAQRLGRSADLLWESSEAAVVAAKEIIDDILGQRTGDALGTYFRAAGHIILNWVPLWLCATRLRLSVQDLTIKVLAHEYAHAYSHRGLDSEDQSWDTSAFAQTDRRIKEGLAQIYCERYAESLREGTGFDGPLKAYQTLMPRQKYPYRCHQEWAPGHPMRLEVVQAAMIVARTRQITRYEAFLAELDRAAQALRS